MKIKASPNMLVTLPCGDLKLMFDDNGIFDTKVFVKDFENKLIDRFDNSNFEKIEEVEEIPFVPEDKTIDYTDRAELLKLAKELDVEGRIATMKTTELAEKVKEALKEGDS